MTPEEFKSIRKKIRLSQISISDEIGKSRRTIQRYEKGILKIPKSITILMEFKLEYFNEIRKKLTNPEIIKEEIKKYFSTPIKEYDYEYSNAIHRIYSGNHKIQHQSYI